MRSKFDNTRNGSHDRLMNGHAKHSYSRSHTKSSQKSREPAIPTQDESYNGGMFDFSAPTSGQ